MVAAAGCCAGEPDPASAERLITSGRVAGVVLGGLLNVGVFLVAFRVLTVRDVALGELVPGAALAGGAWMVLQLAGGYLLGNQISRADQTYGAFAVVIGLLWWFYIQAHSLAAHSPRPVEG